VAAPRALAGFIAAARTNATRPFMGRCVLTTWRDFTMKPLVGKIAQLSEAADCKESLPHRQPPATMTVEPVASSTQDVSNITVTRRQNALALFQAYAEKALTAGVAPKGLEQAFAATLEISPSMWSQIKSSRPIGDKLARQIEQHCKRPHCWLDEERPSEGVSPAEQQFLALALRAWRATNSEGRKALRTHLTELAGKQR
jgi:hypothetical protein